MHYAVGGFLVALSVEDIRYRKIPLWILIVSVLAGGLYGFLNTGAVGTLVNLVPGILMVSLAIAVPKSIGLADGLLTVFYGFLYGWQETCIWLMTGLWLAAAFGVLWSLYKRKRSMQLPLIPFLTLAHVRVWM